MLIIIASSALESSERVERFLFPVSHPDALPLICKHSCESLERSGWTVLYRMFVFVDCGKAVVYDVDKSGKWGED